jgi:hypothetical protein
MLAAMPLRCSKRATLGRTRGLGRPPSLFGEGAGDADGKIMGRRFQRWLGPLVALALASGAVAAASASGATAVGVNVTPTSGDFFTSTKVAAAIRQTKPAWVRVFLGWNAVEPAPGSYNMGYIGNYQHFFSELPRGTKIDVDVEGTPAWAAGGSSNPATPPTDDSTYAAFLNYLVNAFHGRVGAWEIWNEEATSAWWNGTPTQFAGLLKAAYPAVKSADPGATVIVGANDPTFLSAIYAAGAGGSFDAVAVHTDTACNIAAPDIFEFNPGTTTVNQYFFLGFTGIHALMAANGDGAKPIYMTEIGWSSTSAECETGAWAGQKAGGVTPAAQATYLQQAYHCLDQPKYSYVKAAMWFELFNDANSTTPLDNYGLLNNDYSPKPAFAAFQQESLHGDRLTGACGNFNAPVIKILRPTPDQRYSGPLRVAVAASSPGNGVREITILLSKYSRVHFFSKNFAAQFSGSIAWQRAAKIKLGPHTIKVVVTDKAGNVATRTIEVVHMKAPLR